MADPVIPPAPTAGPIRTWLGGIDWHKLFQTVLIVIIPVLVSKLDKPAGLDPIPVDKLLGKDCGCVKCPCVKCECKK